MNERNPPPGCLKTAISTFLVFLLMFALVNLIIYRKQINKTFDDYRGLPARVKALEESVRNTNEMLYKNLKP